MEHRSGIRILSAVLIAAAVGLGAGTASPAFAGPGGRGPCADDMAKYCKDVQPGQGRIMNCMKEHENDLSPGCKAKVAEMGKNRREAREECRDDVVRFCDNVQPGGGRIFKCLKEHENELSAQCKARFEARHGKKAE